MSDSTDASGHACDLQVGVGTSSLQLEMALDGYEHIHNVDYSQARFSIAVFEPRTAAR